MTRFLFGSSAGGHVATPVTIANGGTGATSAQAAIDALTAVSGASTNQVLTKDGSGNASWAAAGGGVLELIEHYSEAAATASSKTFTFSANLKSDYGCIFLLASYFSLNGQLYVTINNNTSAIYAQGGYVNAGSSRSDTGQNQLSINHNTGIGDTKTSCMSIYGNSADGRLNGFWTEQASLDKFETGGFYVGASMSGTISSIEVTTSANTWALGSTFDVYGWKI